MIDLALTVDQCILGVPQFQSMTKQTVKAVLTVITYFILDYIFANKLSQFKKWIFVHFNKTILLFSVVIYVHFERPWLISNALFISSYSMHIIIGHLKTANRKRIDSHRKCK